jgi:DNA (cytosine-5)-methyltransferase 1
MRKFPSAEIETLLNYRLKSKVITRAVERRDGVFFESNQAVIDNCKAMTDSEHFDLSWLRQYTNPFGSADGEEVKIADLFCGCGGMTLGLLESCRALNRNGKVAFACDIVKDYLDVYEHNFKPRIASSDSIESMFDSVIGAKLSTTERFWRSRLKNITIAAGGPPCQGHSDLNNHTRRTDPRNDLYARMARFAEVVEPEHLIIENVLGVKHDRSGVFDRTVNALIKMGYHVDIPVIKAEEIGVPQRRHRAFIVASKSLKLHFGYFDSVLDGYRVKERSVAWACGDLVGNKKNSLLDQTSTLSSESKRRVDWLFDNDEYDLPDSLRPSCHKDKVHTYNSVYGRLYLDKPAWTITTGFLVMGQGRFVHPLERRVITPHEGARLQFFPDFFDFGARTRHGYAKMIGNAVPPKMSFVVATELLR